MLTVKDGVYHSCFAVQYFDGMGCFPLVLTKMGGGAAEKTVTRVIRAIELFRSVIVDENPNQSCYVYLFIYFLSTFTCTRILSGYYGALQQRTKSKVGR